MISTRVIRSGGGSIAIKLAGAALSFISTAFLSRSLSVQEFGFYSVVVSTITFILIPTQLGLPVLVIREAASAKVNNNYERIHHLIIFCQRILILLAALLLLASCFAALFDKKITSWLGQQDVIIIIMAILGMSWLSIASAQIRGYSYVLIGQLPDVVFRPLFFVLIWAGALVVLDQLTYHIAFFVLFLSSALSCLLARIMLGMISKRNKNRDRPKRPRGGWWPYIMPLAILSGAQVINGQIDIVMIGLFRPIEEVANYRISVQMAVMISFGLHALTAMSAPIITTLYKEANFYGLRKYVFQISIMNLSISLPIFIIFVVWGESLIVSFFGGGYSEAFTPLVILALSQLIHTTIGPVTTLMNMLGNEKWSMKVIVFSSVLNVVLNLVLVPHYGMIGAAISTAVSLSLANVALWAMLKKINGIDASIFSAIELGKRKS
ncbi:polysaccharide biosynthesis C-terminal domain-containing protein [Alcanivorax sp. 24]|uniref:oligosaccharide flippase family protein n=1 Tax=Alcanivorax sp. 24 TaxID=2545266 RepID=UPI00105DC869|nr:polysaccharide biosynthesis C-terminal domain-containing protein [Alcanivorax sp. 24]